jgi:type VI secretion system protein VasG
MANIERRALFSKLTPQGFRALRSATAFSKMRRHPQVELVHWLHQLVQEADSDIWHILRHFGIDTDSFTRDLNLVLDQLPRDAGAGFDLSARLDLAMERGWVHASLQFDTARVRSGHILLGCLSQDSLRRHVYRLSGQLERINIQQLAAQFDTLLAGSVEAADHTGSMPAENAVGEPEIAPPTPGQLHQALQRYTVDLTQAARAGKLDAIAGRDDEISQVIDILLRRRQNNPILTGEAGVGKTAIVEGLARRIASGEVPPALRQVSLCALDLGLLTAGAGMKGEFEQRLRQVIDAVQQSETPIILFIDEAHTLVGAGGQAGTGDAANLLKPALARGSLRTIAATTWAEYKKHIEKDPALTRRFQPVPVPEPDTGKAIIMLRAIVPELERHHGVQIREEALVAAVRLGQRYLSDRQLPDKAVSLLDTACARVAIGQQCMPAALTRLRQRQNEIETELAALAREPERTEDIIAREETLQSERVEIACNAAALEERWQSERQLRDRIAQTDENLDAPALDALQKALALARTPDRLIPDHVDAVAIASVVQDWTGIPVQERAGDEIASILNLADALGTRIAGQTAALDQLAQAILCSRAGLDQPDRPQGVFLLAGPSGVGKTETARALAATLFGDERHLITVNMGEFQEAHTVSTLKGAPPGYVGYGQGGVLTEAVRRRPYSVVLLDEIEKAHPDVHEIFYQVFDQGWMEDGEGRMIDFRNTLILLTSNAGADALTIGCVDPVAALSDRLGDHFPAALIGRMTVVPYLPLTDDALASIVRGQFDALASRLAARRSIALRYDDGAVRTVLAHCNTAASGAREIFSVLRRSVMPEIGRAILQGRLDGQPPQSVRIGGDGATFDVTLATSSPNAKENEPCR